MTSTYVLDPSAERLLHLTDVPPLVASWGCRRPHKNAVRRWITIGVRGVVLPSVLVGGRRYSSEPALRWWMAATSALAGPPASSPVAGLPCSAAERATLVRAGIMPRNGGAT